MNDEQQQPKTNHIYWVSVRWSSYTGVAFLTCMGCLLPVTQPAVALIIALYGCYMASEVLKEYVKIRQSQTHDSKTAFNWSLIYNGLEFAYLVAAVIVGAICGLM